VEDLSTGNGDSTHSRHRPFVYWVSRSHGARFLPRGYEKFGPVLDTPNPQAVKAREWLRQYEAELRVARLAESLTVKELRAAVRIISQWAS
jgi:hypothetical protein